MPAPAAPARKDHTCTAAQWVAWIQAVRQWADANAPTLSVTPRASLDGLRALEAGETPKEVADGVAFRGADAELRGKALHAVPLQGNHWE